MLRKITATGFSVYTVTAVLGGIFTFLFGPWNKLFTALVIVMATDIVTGVFLGLMKKSPKTQDGGISSKVGTDGLIRKALIFVTILLAYVVGSAFTESSGLIIRDGTIWCFIAFESVSVLENLDAAGLWIPPFLKKFIYSVKKKADNEDFNIAQTEKPVSDEENNHEEREEAAEPGKS